MRGSAVIDGAHRYWLERDLGQPGPVIMWTLVNPSTADAATNDHTVMKGAGFSRRWGASRFIFGNKFAHRSVNVADLRTAADPIGPLNDAWLELMMHAADIHVVAWGPLAKLPPALRDRWRTVAAIADRVGCRLMCLGTANDGHPLHPLMLAYDTPLVPWRRPN